ncbi:hypothetical protein N9L20_00800 [Flavobacteriaceae bacterium]|nr:hypothetical protein [Flavobacteriaceae bacterium]
MFKSPFKPRSHYVFDYKPRFYNPRKERLEKMIKDAEQSKDSEYQISIDKTNLRDQWSRVKSNGSDRKTTYRLAIIIAVLVGIAAWAFQLHTLF